MGRLNHLSGFLSFILRHKPETVGIQLSEHGWADVDSLLAGMNAYGRKISMEDLKKIVEKDKKGRYAFNEDNTKIRARQGHSVNVDVGLRQEVPPKILYHGTSRDVYKKIQKEGIQKMRRLYVHLSLDYDTAMRVGHRHGVPYVFAVDAEKMHQDGIPFFVSENGIWMTEYVGAEYLSSAKSRKYRKGHSRCAGEF